jgi:hypothetical protein
MLRKSRPPQHRDDDAKHKARARQVGHIMLWDTGRREAYQILRK